MNLVNLISPNAIRTLNSVESKKQLFQLISSSVSPMCGTPSDVIINALLERDILTPASVGRGVAFPHTRLPNIDTVFGYFIKLGKPTDLNAVDQQPVDLIFSIFSPEGCSARHLKALASASRTLRNPAICEKLRTNDNHSILYEILISQDTVRAAA